MYVQYTHRESLNREDRGCYGTASNQPRATNVRSCAAVCMRTWVRCGPLRSAADAAHRVVPFVIVCVSSRIWKKRKLQWKKNASKFIDTILEFLLPAILISRSTSCKRDKSPGRDSRRKEERKEGRKFGTEGFSESRENAKQTNPRWDVRCSARDRSLFLSLSLSVSLSLRASGQWVVRSEGRQRVAGPSGVSAQFTFVYAAPKTPRHRLPCDRRAYETRSPGQAYDEGLLVREVNPELLSIAIWQSALRFPLRVLSLSRMSSEGDPWCWRDVL